MNKPLSLLTIWSPARVSDPEIKSDKGKTAISDTSHTFYRWMVIVAILTVYLLSGCKDKTESLPRVGEESYYWALDEKIAVTKYYGIVTIPHTQGMTEAEIPSLLGVESRNIYLIMRVHEKIWRVEFKNKIPSNLPEIVMPTLLFSDMKEVTMLTGEISVKPNVDTDLGAIIDKYGLSLVKAPTYDTYLYAIPVPAQTLEIANKIQEEENVEWVAPNMISPISRF